MISTELAVRLRDAGLRWTPASGDRFAIAQPAMAGEVFTLSEMTIEAHDYPSGTVLGFNGTTEWALDSVHLDGTLWLPREDQLRELLGGRFRSLDREEDTYRVWLAPVDPYDDDGERIVSAASAEDAYGLALLELIEEATIE